MTVMMIILNINAQVLLLVIPCVQMVMDGIASRLTTGGADAALILLMMYMLMCCGILFKLLIVQQFLVRPMVWKSITRNK